MKFTIKHRSNISVLFECEADSLKLAVQLAISQKVNLSSADLSSADLSSANLRSADVRYANLRSADLRYADLSYADLRSANLSYAKGINKHTCTPLMMLLDQPGQIRAYKLVTSDGLGPFKGGLKYETGNCYEVLDADTSEATCAAGINLATLDWCMREWRTGYRILIAEFTAQDIASIPAATDGKFRVHRCTIVGEKNLKDIGLK